MKFFSTKKKNIINDNIFYKMAREIVPYTPRYTKQLMSPQESLEFEFALCFFFFQNNFGKKNR